MDLRRTRAAALLLAVAVLTACGSTVQQTTEVTVAAQDGSGALAQDGGLGPAAGQPAADAPAGALAVPGAQLPVGQDAPGAADDPGLDGGDGGPTGGTGSAGRGAAPRAGRTAAAPAAPAPAAGTVVRTPLKLGLLYVNNDAASSAGVDNGNTLTTRRVLEALVEAVNSRDGLGGREVRPTYAELRSSSSSYASDLQAACARFTQDADVEVVMSFLGLVSEQFSTCLAKAGTVHVNGSYGLGDTTSIAAETTTLSTIALSTDRRTRATLERLAAVGHLTRSSRIGVLVEGCPYNERAVARTLVPTARRLGLTLASTQSTSCFAGVDDLGRLASDAQGAVLRFASERVDRVLFVSASEGTLLLLFATAAESQGYRPAYALTSLAIPGVIKDNVPQRQLVGAAGLGWLPVTDEDGPLSPTAETRACLAVLKGQGLQVRSRADHFFSYADCDAFSLTDRVLRLTGGATSPSRWFPALASLETGFRGATTVGGRTDFTGGRRDGAAQGRTFAWSTSCSCFRYTGAASPF